MKRIFKSKRMQISKDIIDDGYKYFSDLYNEAIKCISSGRKKQGLKLLERGSREYSTLFTCNYPLSEIIIDDCSSYLANYYERNGKLRHLKKIRKRNFVEYQGEFFLLTTNETIALRLIPLRELDDQGDYDFGIDFPPDQKTCNAVLEIMKRKRGNNYD